MCPSSPSLCIAGLGMSGGGGSANSNNLSPSLASLDMNRSFASGITFGSMPSLDHDDPEKTPNAKAITSSNANFLYVIMVYRLTISRGAGHAIENR